MSAEWIQRLNQSDSRLHKEQVIGEALAASKLGDIPSTRFLKLAGDTYNAYITYGVKQVPETIGITGAENPWQDFIELLTRLQNRAITGNAAKQAIHDISQRFDSDQWNDFCRNVLRRDLRAGVSEKTLNKVLGKTEFKVPVFSCQLATDCTDRPEMSGRKRLEPKLDGVRVLMLVSPWADHGQNITVICYSRNGKVFENFDHIENQIRNNFEPLVRRANTVNLGMGMILDGEVVGRSFQDLMRQARRKEDVQADDSVFHIFDILPVAAFREGRWNTPLSKRVEILESIRPVVAEMPNVELLPHLMVDLDTAEGRDQFRRYAEDQVAAGFEGIMIKNLDAPYECRRNTSWLKFKPTITVDLEVTDVEQGTGRNQGRLGALVCSGTDHGRQIQVNVGSGFSDHDRDSLWSDRSMVIGRTVEILCDVITKNQDGTYSLRFPRFVRFRDDK